ncbi:MAG: tol-pal system-associated acyl-CoA thioesterase [Gammaproteobacteria bacterium]|nr:tol-pal system-associated acyl-CoA thioesterase [Gammaproteobacteria bacterium]
MPFFVFPVRVYYEDTDHGGVVYYANYLKFMERSRTEYLRHCGLEQDVLIAENDLIFAVRRIETDYLQSAKFNDLLLVTAEIKQKSRVKFVFKQQVFKKPVLNTGDANLVQRNGVTDANISSMSGYFDKIENIKADSMLLCEAEVTIASLGASNMRPKRIPEQIFKELMREQ